MTQQCKICNTTISSACNALSLHLKTHNISQKEYYVKFIGEQKYCSICDKETDFKGITKGFLSECSNSCRSKVSWAIESAKERKSILSKRLSDHNIRNGKGRPLGSKNKNHYPIDSPKVIKRIEKLMIYLHSINHWHNVNERWWSTAPSEKILDRLNKLLHQKHKVDENYDMYALTLPAEGQLKLCRLFNMPDEVS